MPLPLVLLGPILRRVEPRLVSVFVATSRPASIHLSVYDGPTDSANPGPELLGADAQTTRFGAQFHATVVSATITEPTLPLAAGHRYSYDLRITPSGGTAQNLKDLGFLSDSTLPGYGNQAPANATVEVCAISYVDGQLPSFMTAPGAADQLVLVHASCRKAHGDGHPALQYADDLIDDLHGADDGRPHMLFFTGDQIYADDVATSLLPGLNQLAIQLIGGDGNSAPIEKVASPTSGSLDVSMAVMPSGYRQRLTGRSGLTSEMAAGHLVGFGEFLAMYCIAWNPMVWPVLAVADTSDPNLKADLKTALQKDAAAAPNGAPVVLGKPPSTAPSDLVTPLYDSTDAAKEALDNARLSFLDDKRRLDEFRREVPKVRRLMANVPTYMICDDHDVTDDWFMTGAIRTATCASPFGRAIVRNALSAYVVCQAWGDDPKQWSTDNDHTQLLANISGLFPDGWSGGLPVSSASDAVDATLGLTPNSSPKFDFSYSVDGPFHRVRVLDTRMRRQYDAPNAPPGLLTSSALDHQLPIESLPDGHVLIVVSPAPVFGPPVLSEIGGPLLVSKYDLVSMIRSRAAQREEQAVTGLPSGRPTGQQAYDVEHWGANPVAFERLLERLSHFPRVVVLGGDVHYGAAYAMDWTGNGRTARIVHFTSSAAHNAWTGVPGQQAPTFVRNLMLYNGMATGLQHVGLPMVRLGWNNTLPPVVSDTTNEPPLAKIALQTGPVLLTNEMFRKQHPLTRPPDWAWRAAPITDVRAPADRPAAARATMPANDLPSGSDAVNHYGDAAAVHVQGLRTVAVNRGLQFLDNIGVITFDSNSNQLGVSQALLSLRPRQDPNEKGAAYLVFHTSLEPDPVTVPTTIGPA